MRPHQVPSAARATQPEIRAVPAPHSAPSECCSTMCAFCSCHGSSHVACISAHVLYCFCALVGSAHTVLLLAVLLLGTAEVPTQQGHLPSFWQGHLTAM